MNIAAARWIPASYRSALGVAWGRQRHGRRLYSKQADVPPHLELPSAIAARPTVTPNERENRVKAFYITTPIFYPNAVPHIGHLYSLVVADIFARYARITMPERRVRFVTGTDEHGLKIQKAAEARNMEPQEFCDHLCHAFSSLADQAAISHTKFVRTSGEDHCVGVQALWRDLVKSGHVYLGEHSGWYSVSDECFYTDSQIRTETKLGSEVKVSIETGNVVEWTKEENYKFSLSKFKVPLLNHFKANSDAIHPLNQRKEIMDILESSDTKALPDLSISRPSWRLKWGIPVPNDSSQTIYVWLDALTSYLTGIGYPWVDAADMASGGWPANLQIVGKDILKFHAIYFPAFLMALKMPLPRALLSHAHWTVRKAKMSKSVGNVVDPFAVLKDHGVDVIRWYMARTGGHFKTDIDWSNDQVLKFAGELRSLLGNVLLRLRSRKILERLPAAFHHIPLHRDILMTRGNAPALVSEPGSEQYDDKQEDRRHRHEIGLLGDEVDYANEYTERIHQSNVKKTAFSVPPKRTSGVVWYSELPEARLDDDELPIVSTELRDALDVLRGKVAYHIQRYELGDAAQSIVDVLSLLNKEITRIQPWSEETQPREVIHLLTWGRETLRICGILLQPFMPDASQALLDAMHVHPKARTYVYACIGAGRVRAGPLEKVTLFPNKYQRSWKEVETDHKWEEHEAKKRQLKGLEQDRSLQTHRERRWSRRLNKLYSRRFDPYGSPTAPDRGVRPKWWKPLMDIPPVPEKKISLHAKRRKFLRHRYLLKRERQKNRESI